MTIGVSIGMDVRGGTVVASELQKVKMGVESIAKAEQAAAAAATHRGNAQAAANRHAAAGMQQAFHGAPGSGGFGHAIRVAGFASHEIHHISRGLGRAARFGGVAIGAAAFGMAGSAILESLEFFHERMAEVVKRSAEITKTIRRAGGAFNEGALGTADRYGLDLNRLSTMGASFQDVKRAQAGGLSPSGLAEIYGARNSDAALRAALAARRFGMDPNAAAREIGKMGGVNDGTDPFELAAYLAGRAQDRIITPEQIARARAGGGRMGGRLADIESIQGRTGAAMIAGIESGAAGKAAADQLNKATSPEAYAMTAAWKEATEQSEVLNKIAENTGWLLKTVQNLTSTKGSATVQAIRATEDNAAVLGSVHLGASE